MVMLLAIFAATHLPHVEVPGGGHGDKFFHAAAYLMLTFLAMTSWELSSGILQPQHYFWFWLVATLYALMDELTQIPVGRNCDGLDWIADIVGIVLGLWVFRTTRPLIYRLL